ncbi:MAG: amidohydrolase family protein [Chloroflexi bacterium]|nr:amidohydrolase family protein [Chloroflexota bacterium]
MRLRIQDAPLVTPNGVVDQTLTFDDRSGRILPPDAIRPDRRIGLAGYMLLPGLVNAHDHLELNHFPRTKFREVYPNAHIWGEEVSAQLGNPPFAALRSYPLRDRCWIGGIKNLLAGVTTVAHHNPLHRPLRSTQFPVRVIRRYGWAHSLHFETPGHLLKSYQPGRPWIIHLAEGTDEIAAKELRRLAAMNLLTADTILVHGVGLTPEDAHYAIEKGAGLVWCPSTNAYLLGQTTDVRPWVRAGRVALGSDSRLTADGDLLDELRAAPEIEGVDVTTLFRLVTDYAARVLSIPGAGALTPGSHADIVVLRYQDHPHSALVKTRRRDIGLVIRGGKVMFGDPEIVQRFPGEFRPILLDGQRKLMARQLVRGLQKSRLSEPGLVL